MRPLGTIFDEDAERYARARPGYPAALLDDLLALAALRPGSRVAEIGPGTGQATRALAARGITVIAVEPGARLAEVLRRRCEGLPVEVVNATFEDWDGPAEPVDAVVAFTAWHWVDATTRAERVAAVLRPGGALATVTTEHVLGGTVAFFHAAQRCYEHWDPATPPDLRLIAADDLPPFADEIDGHPRFEPAARRRHAADAIYSRDAYLDVLLTYSGHRAHPAAQQSGLLTCAWAT